MTDRRYGVLPGTTITGTPPPYQPTRTSSRLLPERSDHRAYHNGFQLGNDHTETPPPPPIHRIVVPSTRQESDPRHSFDTTASDISDYHPQDAGLRALQHLSGLYIPAVRKPSPEERTAYKPHDRRSFTHSRSSEQSIVPLMAHSALPGLQSPSPIRLPSRLDARQSCRIDGYEDMDPEDIADAGEIVSPNQRGRNRLGFGSVPINTRQGTNGSYDALQDILDEQTEKSGWMNEERDRARRRKCLLWIFGIVVLATIIVAASVGGVVASRQSASRTSS